MQRNRKKGIRAVQVRDQHLIDKLDRRCAVTVAAALQQEGGAMNNIAHVSPVAFAVNEGFTYYPLPGLLPESTLLVFNPTLGTLVCLLCDHEQDGPRLLGEQQFTPNEVCLLRPLLASYPDYCA
ncbi:MAG: hypothetical protein WCD86_22520 [Ktedonobacteraceae bacterium]